MMRLVVFGRNLNISTDILYLYIDRFNKIHQAKGRCFITLINGMALSRTKPYDIDLRVVCLTMQDLHSELILYSGAVSV